MSSHWQVQPCSLWSKNSEHLSQQENVAQFRFPGLSRTCIRIPRLSRPGKWFVEIQGLSKFSRACTNPGIKVLIIIWWQNAKTSKTLLCSSQTKVLAASNNNYNSYLPSHSGHKPPHKRTFLHCRSFAISQHVPLHTILGLCCDWLGHLRLSQPERQS